VFLEHTVAVIPWSIARWDFEADVMDVTLSLQDEDRVAVKFKGILNAIRHCPMFFEGGNPVIEGLTASRTFTQDFLFERVKRRLRD
jgi:hypothetical protein